MTITSSESTRSEAVHGLFDVLMRFSRTLRSLSVDWDHVTSSLTRGDVVTLGTVQRGGSTRPSAIAATLGVDPSVVSRHLATLHRLGLVVRGTDPRDGRAELISISPAGSDELLAAREAMCEALADRLGGWDAATIARTAAAVADLADLLGGVPPVQGPMHPRLPDTSPVHSKEAHA